MSVIGVIDSGAGGISTLSAAFSLLPAEDFLYVADKSHSPYGEKSDSFVIKRVSVICKMLVETGADALLIACNTATNLCIDFLRKEFKGIIIVGVEPAIKPAVEELTYGKVLTLLTSAAATAPKFLALLNSFNPNKIIVSPQPRLASLIENNIGNLNKIGGEVESLLSPLKSPEIESVVLGCTHYCLIRDMIAGIFDAKVYDGNTGAAIRLYSQLKQEKLLCRGGRHGKAGYGGSIKFITL